VSEPRVDQADTVPNVPPSESTPYRRLVEHVLGVEDICTYVERRSGDGMSRRAIARELTEQIGVDGVRISDTMLIRWCGGGDK
jgi:hypothetical protein